MKMAKARQQDIDAAIAVLGILDAIDGGYYPTDPDAPEAEVPTFFDPDDKAQLRHLYDLLTRQIKRSPGGMLRVVMGFATIMSNNIVDPALDHLELHPRLAHGLVAAEENRRLRMTLERIERWDDEFPETNRKHPDGSPMSYSSIYGIGGERDYMRKLARQALNPSEFAANPIGEQR
ncbi:hypothetical protein [Nevskia sp.]|uniref:hypothetical protein n=1 Tax=Nevskia sp. TaxID=1929292 RepID=UPI0025D2665B|nr:hypothetical protein [Nevskia sp.]